MGFDFRAVAQSMHLIKLTILIYFNSLSMPRDSEHGSRPSHTISHPVQRSHTLHRAGTTLTRLVEDNGDDNFFLLLVLNLKAKGEIEIQTLKSIPLSERVPMLPGG